MRNGYPICTFKGLALAGLLMLVTGPLEAQVRRTPTRIPTLTLPRLLSQPTQVSIPTGGSATVTVTGQNLDVNQLTGLRVLRSDQPTTMLRATWMQASGGRGVQIADLARVPGQYRLQAQHETTWLDVPLSLTVFQPTATTAPTAPASARYRLTLNGFEVFRETWDDALQRDGKRDEVFFDAVVVENGRSVARQPTPTYGDVAGYASRTRAGSASSQGGLRSSDRFPSASPWRRTSSPQPLALPWVLWEGTLTAGQGAVTVSPNVLEWDMGVSSYQEWVGLARDVLKAVTEAPAFKEWVSQADKAAADAAKAAAEKAGTTYQPEMGIGVYLDLAKVGLDALYRITQPDMGGQEKTRPIGGSLVNGVVSYTPRPIVLTYHLAEATLASYSEFGPGIWMVPYYDDDTLQGKYHLYFQLERLP